MMEWKRFTAGRTLPAQACPGDTRRRLRVARGFGSIAALCAGMAALAGCGGGGGVSGGSTHIRAINACPNGGQATILFNGTNYNGTLGFSLNSVYLNLDSGSDTFTFSLSSASSTNYSGVTQTLSNGGYYSAVVFGRTDVTTSTDARRPQIKIVSDDPTPPPTGDARLRVVQAAPDAPSIDLLIDGQIVASNVPYTNAGSYVNIAGGSHTIQINQTGTSTVLVPAQALSPAAGLVYSIYVLEGTVSPTPTYTVEQFTDAR